MIKRQVLLIACCFFFASMGFAQSLAELAKKEKERRQQIASMRESLKQGRSESAREARSSAAAAPRSSAGSAPSYLSAMREPSPCEEDLTERKDLQALFDQGSARDAAIDTPCRQVGVEPHGVLIRVPRGGLKGGPAVRQTASASPRRPAARATVRSPRGGMRY